MAKKTQSRASSRDAKKTTRKKAPPERRSRATDRRSVKQRRRNQRLNVSKRVDYVFKDKKQFGYTKDIGARGLFLRTSKVLPEEIQRIFCLGRNSPSTTRT